MTALHTPCSCLMQMPHRSAVRGVRPEHIGTRHRTCLKSTPGSSEAPLSTVQPSLTRGEPVILTFKDGFGRPFGSPVVTVEAAPGENVMEVKDHHGDVTVACPCGAATRTSFRHLPTLCRWQCGQALIFPQAVCLVPAASVR